VRTIAHGQSRFRGLRAAGASVHFSETVENVDQLGCLSVISVESTHIKIAVICRYSALFCVISCLNGVPPRAEPSRVVFPVSTFLRYFALRRSAFPRIPSFLIFNSAFLVSSSARPPLASCLPRRLGDVLPNHAAPEMFRDVARCSAMSHHVALFSLYIKTAIPFRVVSYMTPCSPPLPQIKLNFRAGRGRETQGAVKVMPRVLERRLEGTAKERPCTEAPKSFQDTIPTTRPDLSTSGPPLLPGLILASVWRKLA
jgi:hypothetical protein